MRTHKTVIGSGRETHGKWLGDKTQYYAAEESAESFELLTLFQAHMDRLVSAPEPQHVFRTSIVVENGKFTVS